jgi:hypothetical protein
MTRPVLLASLSLLAQVEALAAAEVGDGEQARYLARLSDEAVDLVGDGWAGALERAEEWLAGRHVPSAEEGLADVGT